MYVMEATDKRSGAFVIREFATMAEAKRAGVKCYGAGMDVVVVGPRGGTTKLVQKLRPSGKRNVEGKPSGKVRWT